ncbi:MAG: T6SS effector amidase Tae4 family protein [Pseudomonadota bacterium]
MAKPVFSDLWANYPTEQSPCDQAWANQCAIRMSLCLNGEGSIKINSRTYTEPKCRHGNARGAESLANFLWKFHLKRPKIWTDGATAKEDIKHQNGIIFFKDCFTRSGQTSQTGDHIDLWKAGMTKTFNDPSNKAKQVWFWKL